MYVRAAGALSCEHACDVPTERSYAHGHRNPDRAWEDPSCSSTRPAEIEAWMQKPLRLGTSPFSWTCGRGRFGRRPGGRECSAPPRTTQNACLPLSSRMPPLDLPLSSQPCARPLTRGIPLIPETPRMPNAAPHVCACRGRPLVRGACVAPPGSACSRRLWPAVRWSDRAHAAARGNPDESVAADASGASHGARRAHARERCGACWSSAQRAPEPAYARVT